MKTFLHPQFSGRHFLYESVGHLYQILTWVFQKNFRANKNFRESTILLTTVSNQSQLDWETGANINCFSSDGLLHFKASKLTNDTLYILQHAVIYYPRHQKHNELKDLKLP